MSESHDALDADSGNAPIKQSGSSADAPDIDPKSLSKEQSANQLSPGELIERHQRGIWRYLRMLGCDCSTADDLTQETFLRVLRKDSFVQHNDAATSSYLRRTAYNLLVSNHRKHGRVQTVAEPVLLDEIWNRWAGKDCQVTQRWKPCVAV